MSNQENNLNLANYIITLATKPNAKENIALLLESLFDSNQKDKQEEERLERAASSIVTFSKKEIEKMPQKFRKIFNVVPITKFIIDFKAAANFANIQTALTEAH